MTPTDIILAPAPLTEEALTALTDETQRHPYFHAAAIALTHTLFLNHSPLYGDALRATAPGVPDRTALFALIEGQDYQIQPQSTDQPTATDTPSRPAQPDQQRVTSLIDRYLDTLPAPAQRRPQPADAATDYIAFLMQDQPATPPASKNPPTPPASKNSIDPPASKNSNNSENSENSENSKNSITPASITPLAPPPADDENPDLTPEYFTETMARIYIKQGKFDKAGKIISRLNAKYPKKNRYFADQMRFLEKLMLNQSHSKH